VVHVGGINFFDVPALAAREMVRVARPGARIVIADETKQVVNDTFKTSAMTRRYFKDLAVAINPRDWLPATAG